MDKIARISQAAKNIIEAYERVAHDIFRNHFMCNKKGLHLDQQGIKSIGVDFLEIDREWYLNEICQTKWDVIIRNEIQKQYPRGDSMSYQEAEWENLLPQ